MSDVLAVAIWRSKAARQTPRVVNVVKVNDPLENEVTKLKAEMESILDKNQELAGEVRNLRISRQRLLQELTAAKKGISHLLKEPIFAEKAAPALREMLEAVSQEFGIHTATIRSANQTRDVSLARQSAMYLFRRVAKRSFPFIGKYFERDHSSVCHAITKVERLRQINPEFHAKLMAIENRFSDVSSQPAVNGPAGPVGIEAQPEGA